MLNHRFLKIILIILFPEILLAASIDDSGAVLQDLQAKQSIESERQDLIRKKESQEVENIGKFKLKSQELKFDDKALDNYSCRIIKFFEIVGNKEVSKLVIEKNFIKPLEKSKADFCFTKFDLGNLQKEITNYYLKKGYVLARVYVDISKINEEKIIIIIEEGKLDKLEIKDNSKLNDIFPIRRSLQRFSAFPFLQNNSNDVVNLRDIEQGIEQINRLSSQNAKMSIIPSLESGYSDIIIENKISNQANVSLTSDNSGQENTGVQKRKVALNYDNLLGINDNIYLNYSQSNALPIFGSGKQVNDIIGGGDNSNLRYSKSFYGAASIPFGYYTFGASYSYSKYLLTTSGIATTFQSSGNSESKTFYLDRVLLRGQKFKTSLKAELERSDTDSYLEDTYIPVNSRRTTQVNLYLNNTFYIPSGSIYVQPKYSKGLKTMGAMKDPAGLSADRPRAQFETYGLYVQTNLNFDLPKINKTVNHRFTFDSQKSKDSLYGFDQFALGGRYTLRGFQQNIISGDNGYLLRNDLSMRLSDMMSARFLDSEFANNSIKDFSIKNAISKMRFGIFYDYGHVRNKIVDTSYDNGYMSGVGGVLSYLGKNLNWDVTYSKGLHSPQFVRTIDNKSHENETIYFSLTFNFGLL
jgi:hemolysin activation/secretion protein